MIELSNGHRFSFCCGAGALAFDGRGWPWDHPFRWAGLLRPKEFTVVAKTVTLKPRKGNLRWWKPWTCVKLLKEGNVVNAVGLTNPGVHHWSCHGYEVAKQMGYKVAASVAVERPEEATELGFYLADLNLAYIEFNASCPNTGQVFTDNEIVDAVNRLWGESMIPVVVKLSYAQAMNTRLIHMLEDSYAEAVHCINTVPWSTLYPNETSPLASLGGGGVSGPDIYHHAQNAVRHVKRYAPNLPIIAGGGIESEFDALTFKELGAGAFSIGTLFMRKPWAPNRLIREYEWIVSNPHQPQTA
jgi:dihydroorotate dehydrogenase (NAD+) catalytic subunit